jgi:hypothetical protein
MELKQIKCSLSKWGPKPTWHIKGKTWIIKTKRAKIITHKYEKPQILKTTKNTHAILVNKRGYAFLVNIMWLCDSQTHFSYPYSWFSKSSKFLIIKSDSQTLFVHPNSNGKLTRTKKGKEEKGKQTWTSKLRMCGGCVVGDGRDWRVCGGNLKGM